jgi:hypothetical protein
MGVEDTASSYLEDNLAAGQQSTTNTSREALDPSIPDSDVNPRLNKFRMSVARMGFQP